MAYAQMLQENVQMQCSIQNKQKPIFKLTLF